MDRTTNTTSAAYGLGLTTALFGGFTVQEVAIWVGILCTVGTFIINSYFRWKDDKREEQRFKREQDSAYVGAPFRGAVHGKSHGNVPDGDAGA